MSSTPALPVLSGSFCSLPRSVFTLAAFLCLLGAAPAQDPAYDPPPDYYDPAVGLSDQPLREALHEIIDDHTRIPYTSTAPDTWDALAQVDTDPSSPGSLRTLYVNSLRLSEDHTSTGWNREQVWPNVYGFPDDNSCNYPYSDLHQLFPADPGTNNARGSKPFDWCTHEYLEYPVELYPQYVSKGIGREGEEAWEVWPLRRGDVARALFYLDIRYEGDTHAQSACAEPDLILTDNRALIVRTDQNLAAGHMGMLSTLLQWHEDDPVSEAERRRNHLIFGLQGNRNPFVDHPEWTNSIWGEPSPTATPSPSPSPTPVPTPSGPHNVWINEIHYDNEGTDEGEMIEVAGPAGTDLTGWSVAGYNGNGGGVYATVALSGVIASQMAGFGVLVFEFPGMQNGAPDALALLDPVGTVVQFLSYEGEVTATDGPAMGTSSTPLGVEETSTTTPGYSLQLIGTGATYADFEWSGPSPATPGQINDGQVFQGTQTTPTSPPAGLHDWFIYGR